MEVLFMAKVKNEHYITIQEFMVNDLELSGNELIAYALIYGFSQDGESYFKGSLSYVAKWLNCSKATACTILNKLSDDGFLEKKEKNVNGVRLCDYTAYPIDEEVLKQIKEKKKERKEKEKAERYAKKLNGIKKTNTTYSKKLNEGVQKTLTHNNIDILEDNTNTLSVERAASECEQLEPKNNQSKPNRKKEANALFEQLWSLYPLKKGKASVSDTQKLKLLDIGYEELERAISRYVKYVDSVDYLHYKNGSTFFNSGYVDYLDENYTDGDANNNTHSNYQQAVQPKHTDANNNPEDHKEAVHRAMQKAAEQYGEQYGEQFFEGMSDGDIEGMLGLLGIDVV